MCVYVHVCCRTKLFFFDLQNVPSVTPLKVSYYTMHTVSKVLFPQTALLTITCIIKLWNKQNDLTIKLIHHVVVFVVHVNTVLYTYSRVMRDTWWSTQNFQWKKAIGGPLFFCIIKFQWTGDLKAIKTIIHVSRMHIKKITSRHP